MVAGHMTTKAPNKTLHATADVTRSSSVAWSHNVTVADAWGLPSAVRELGRCTLTLD